MVRFCWNLKHNIFTCLPIIIEMKIFDWGSPCRPPPILKKVKFFIYGAILLKLETQHLHMFTNNNWDKNLWLGGLLAPPPNATPILKKVKFFIYGAIFLKFETQQIYLFTNNNWDKNLWLGVLLPPSCKKSNFPFMGENQTSPLKKSWW